MKYIKSGKQWKQGKKLAARILSEKNWPRKKRSARFNDEEKEVDRLDLQSEQRGSSAKNLTGYRTQLQ